MKKYFSLLILCVWIALVLILSFQNGTETAQTSHGFTTQILKLFTRGEPSWELIATWDSRFRLYAHVGIFLVYGVISLMVLLDWMKGTRQPLVLSAVSGVAFAVLSEVGKLPIEGRHCDIGEMQLNIAGALMGTVFWYILVKLGKSVKAKRLAFMTSVLLLFGVVLFNASTTSYAYTEEEKQQAKAWLSSHGYSADMGGASAAYQDYLNGKFDEELGVDMNGDGIPAASTEATDTTQTPGEATTELSSENGTGNENTEQGAETGSSEANGTGVVSDVQGTENGTTQESSTAAMTTEATTEASEVTATENDTEENEVTTEVSKTTESTEDAEESGSLTQNIIVVLIIACVLIFGVGICFKRKNRG